MRKLIYIVTIALIGAIKITAQIESSVSDQNQDCFQNVNPKTLTVDTIIKLTNDDIPEIYSGPYPPTTPGAPEDWKNVFFVHGLGGGKTTWAKAIEYTANTYKISLLSESFKIKSLGIS